jgi:energy-coupling factor transport system substrate-specific component
LREASLKEALLFAATMFQAMGVHGPELTPVAQGVLNTLLVLAAFLFLFTAPRANRFTVAALSTMVVALAALRVLFEPLPNVQPVTVATLLVASQLGARRGVAFAVLVTLLSNLLIGNGWWTVFQALGWGAVALYGSRLVFEEDGVFKMGRLCIASVVSALLFSLISTLSLLAPGVTPTDLGWLLLQGLPFDALHVMGNVVFALWFGPTVHAFLHGLEHMDDDLQPVGDSHVHHG